MGTTDGIRFYSLAKYSLCTNYRKLCKVSRLPHLQVDLMGKAEDYNKCIEFLDKAKDFNL